MSRYSSVNVDAFPVSDNRDPLRRTRYSDALVYGYHDSVIDELPAGFHVRSSSVPNVYSRKAYHTNLPHPMYRDEGVPSIEATVTYLVTLLTLDTPKLFVATWVKR